MYFCERDYEPSDHIQGGEFSDWLLKNKCAHPSVALLSYRHTGRSIQVAKWRVSPRFTHSDISTVHTTPCVAGAFFDLRLAYRIFTVQFFM